MLSGEMGLALLVSARLMVCWVDVLIASLMRVFAFARLSMWIQLECEMEVGREGLELFYIDKSHGNHCLAMKGFLGSSVTSHERKILDTYMTNQRTRHTLVRRSAAPYGLIIQHRDTSLLSRSCCQP